VAEIFELVVRLFVERSLQGNTNIGRDPIRRSPASSGFAKRSSIKDVGKNDPFTPCQLADVRKGLYPLNALPSVELWGRFDTAA